MFSKIIKLVGIIGFTLLFIFLSGIPFGYVKRAICQMLPLCSSSIHWLNLLIDIVFWIVIGYSYCKIGNKLGKKLLLVLALVAIVYAVFEVFFIGR